VLPRGAQADAAVALAWTHPADARAPLASPGGRTPRGRRLAHEEFAARQQAEAILAAAEASAQATRLDAAKHGEADAREGARAELAAAWIALRAAEDQRAARDLDRAIDLAVLLSERLLGEALAVDPTRIAAIARQVLAEARGVRRIRIEVAPGDADGLASRLAELGLPDGSIGIEVAHDLARGSLRMHTDLGIIDAPLTLRLERLARALRDAL
jgi:flagellar assembly protein FliH/type III secretion protein L